MLEVVLAEHAGNYRIRVAFNNGERGIVDLADALWGPMFEPLKDPDKFKNFRVSPIFHTIQWENDADLAPEFLYCRMLEQSGTQAGR